MYRAWTPSIWETITAAIISAIGYFSPIKDITHMVLIFFFIDIIYGWRADKKLNGASFSPRKVWDKTVPRMMLTLVILLGAFVLDRETGQNFVHTYKIVGWFISALLLISIAKNGYLITNWGALNVIGKILKKKVEKESGIEITEKDLQ